MTDKQFKELNEKIDNVDWRNKWYSTVLLIAMAFFTFLITQSCTSQRKIDKICATCPTETIIQHDSIVVNKTDTIYRTSQLDSLLFVSTIDRTKQVDTVYFEDNTWKAQFYVSNAKLKAHIEHLSDSISTIIKTKETTVKQAETKVVKVPVEKIVAKYDKWFYILMIGSILLVVVIVGWIWMQWQKGKVTWLSKFLN